MATAPKVNIEELSVTLNNQNLPNRGTSNETTPAEQRAINPDVPLSDGPIRGENDSYKPASYKTNSTIKRGDRDPIPANIVRTDR